jgi:NTP pyrophosphatase (non-canonical NTP hydrolase)
VDLERVQEEADALVRGHPQGYWSVLRNLARLVEEVGELARALGQREGKPRKEGEPPVDAAEEMGDILFTLALLANQLGISLDEAYRGVLGKYRSRQGAGAAGGARGVDSRQMGD